MATTPPDERPNHPPEPEADWRARSAGRRANAAAARKRQQKAMGIGAAALAAFVVVVVASFLLVPRLIAGMQNGPKAPRGVAKTASGGQAAGVAGSAGGDSGSGAAAGAGAAPPAAAAPPTSIVRFEVSPRIFTPSTIGDPVGNPKLVPKTRLKLWARRPVGGVAIVAYPPAAYAAAHGAPVPATTIYEGPLKKGRVTLEWDGLAGSGDVLPRGIYRIAATVKSDSIAKDDAGRSIETTVDLESYATIGNRKKKLVAITIDDGWNADPRILELLKNEKIPATAFFIGGRGVANTHPEQVTAAMDAGLEIAGHTWDHYLLTGYPEDKVVWDVTEGQKSVQKVSGYDHHWMRPPGGALYPTTVQAIYRAGFVPVMWTVDTEDTNSSRTNSHRIATTMDAVRTYKGGTIILCHWGGHGTYEILSTVIPQIKAMGLGFGTLAQVMEGLPGYTAEGPAPAMVTSAPAH